MAEAKKQTIDLGLSRQDWQDRTERAELRIETSKSSFGGISSDAKVVWASNSGYTHAFGLGGPGDFSMRSVQDRATRATQKNIDAMHARVFTPERIAELTAAAIAHYPMTTFYRVVDVDGEKSSDYRSRKTAEDVLSRSPGGVIEEFVKPAYRSRD